MAKVSVATVLLLVVVPMCMYTCAFLIGVQLGRELERNPGRNQLGVHLVRTLVWWFPNGVGGLLVVTARGASAGYATTNSKAAEKVAVSYTWQKPQNHFFISNAYDDEVASRSSGGVRRSSSPKQPYHGVAIPLPPADHVPNRQSTTATTASVTIPSTQRYYNNNHTSPRPRVISMGPWGGHGGKPFRMSGATSVPLLRGIILHHSSAAILGLACEYSLAGEDGSGYKQIRMAGPWGLWPSSLQSAGGIRLATKTVTPGLTLIMLSACGYLTAVEGTIGHVVGGCGIVVISLTFRTSQGKTYGPYGGSGGTPFSVPAKNGCIVGFWGRAGRQFLNAIGIYIKPCATRAPKITYSNYPDQTGMKVTVSNKTFVFPELE